jgi:hypothetical protein
VLRIAILAAEEKGETKGSHWSIQFSAANSWLITAGIQDLGNSDTVRFLARELHSNQKVEDCVLSGRTNCVPIDTHSSSY